MSEQQPPPGAGADLMRLTGSPGQARAVVDRLFREYLHWAVAGLPGIGARVEDPGALVERHHEAFQDELPVLLGPRGRLVVARLDPDIVGVAALKPVGADVAEVKRVYVRPHARGKGIARRLLRLLLADAGTLGYRTVRLETAPFMTEALALYASLGFRDVSAFPGAETSMSGLARHMRFMEVHLPTTAQGSMTGTKRAVAP